MKKLISVSLLVLVFTSHSFGNCLPLVDKKIEQKQQRLLFAKKKQKKTVLGTFLGTGIPAGALYGTAFKLIADGATVAASVLVGSVAGAMVGGGIVGVVVVPMFIYNQVIKAQIRKYKKTKKLLIAALENDHGNKYLKKMLKKIKKKKTEMTMDKLVGDLTYSNSQFAFCSEDTGRVLSVRKIRKYLAAHNIATQE